MIENRIMIVEDEAIIAADIQRQLEEFNYEVVATAFSGGQAISLARELRPNLILMDIVLKGSIDGITAAQTIIESLKVPVIFLTAYSDPATLNRAKTVGAYGFLIKPFRSEELLASIEVALYKHQLEKKLNESEQWFAKTLFCISDAVIATDAEARIRFMNPVAEKVTGWQMEQAKGTDINKLIKLLAEADRAIAVNPVTKALKDLCVTGLESDTLLITQSGDELPIDDGAAPIIDDNGTLLGAVFVFRDITERRRIENLLRESEERFHSAFDLAAIGMALVAINGCFLQVNNSICEIFGYLHEELLKLNLQMLVQGYDKMLEHHLKGLVSDADPAFQVEVECHHKTVGKKVWVLLSASLVRNGAAEPQYYIIQIQDITDRKYAEKQLNFIANHDPLTGLVNRVQFHNYLNDTLSSVRRHETKLALMFLDLDRFKLINDTLGHRIGDLLLQAVSDRLKSSLRINDVLARLGGDEFIVLLNDIHLIDDVAKIARKTIDTLTQPFTLEGNDIVITASIGISIFPNDGDEGQMLLMNADTAMYLAKERGKNNYQFYTQEMTERSLERMTIERGLRYALTHDGFRIHCLPQVDLTSGQTVSVEALVRWQHPEWGLVYPDRFIDIAEDTGLIVPIGRWVLRTACLQTKKRQEYGGSLCKVAVNLSARQFLENDLFHTIKDILLETGLDPSSLELEITESAIMQDPDKTLQVLHQLCDLGVKLSVDDFGTGYSSLTYLRQFPVHNVKIDRSFVKNIPNDENSMTLVRAIIALGHQLNLSVTAEGVETLEQLKFLKAHQCDLVQGYFFSKPVPAEHLETDFRFKMGTLA
jgi:diguanylate cyclase (GGDEF)-like protein/PAS domain S-box-containing protein